MVVLNWSFDRRVTSVMQSPGLPTSKPREVSVAILARGAEPLETRRGLPGVPSGSGSRYIEAAVQGLLIGCLYLPNGNPAPGPKFDGKLGWLRCLQNYAAKLLDLGIPVVLAGD